MIITFEARGQEIIDHGVLIGVVDADNESAERWIQFINRVAKLGFDWRYELYQGQKLPHVYCARKGIRSRAVSGLERFAYRLKGKLVAVACDHSSALRPPLSPEQAERDLRFYEDECEHLLWNGIFGGLHCPECGALMIDFD